MSTFTASSKLTVIVSLVKLSRMKLSKIGDLLSLTKPSKAIELINCVNRLEKESRIAPSSRLRKQLPVLVHISCKNTRSKSDWSNSKEKMGEFDVNIRWLGPKVTTMLLPVDSSWMENLEKSTVSTSTVSENTRVIVSAVKLSENLTKVGFVKSVMKVSTLIARFVGILSVGLPSVSVAN